MVRLVTYNIQGARRDRLPLLGEVLQALAADVVVRQEVPDASLVRALADHLGLVGFVARSNLTRHLALLTLSWLLRSSAGCVSFQFE